MTTNTTTRDGLGIGRHPASSLSMPARVAAAATLVLGLGLHLASVVILAVPHDSDPTARLTWVAENPGSAQLSKVLDVLFVPFMVGGVVVHVLLGRLRSPRLAWVGGVLFAGGLVGLATHEGYEAFAYTLVIDGPLDPQATAAVMLESSPADAAAQVLFLSGLVNDWFRDSGDDEIDWTLPVYRSSDYSVMFPPSLSRIGRTSMFAPMLKKGISHRPGRAEFLASLSAVEGWGRSR